MNSNLEAALDYARRGWSIIPMQLAEKKPPCRWKRFQRTPADETQLRKWFENHPEWGVGVVFGAGSGGLGCRDFDEWDAWHEWSIHQPALVGTLPMVETRRGVHVYFRVTAEDEAEFRKRIGKADSRGAIDCGDGELRIGASYCVLPPSQHPSGHVYAWKKPLPESGPPFIDLWNSGLFPKSALCNIEDGESAETSEDGDDLEDSGEPRQPMTLTASGFASENHPTLLSVPGVKEAIERTLPQAGGQRHRAVFELARYLKAIPALAEATQQDLRPIVMAWHQRALPNIRTKDPGTTLLDFAEGWAKVIYPKGKGAIDKMFANLKLTDLPKEAVDYSAEHRKLTAFCRELQRAAGQEPFFLSARTAGDLLEVNHTTAWRWLRLMQHDEILRMESQGSRAEKKANRYRYLRPL